MLSFLTLWSSSFRIKNLKKEGALGIKGAPVGYTGLLIFLYTTLETICQFFVYGQFLYFSSPTGHFEWKTALLLYYGHVAILILFNIVFNKSDLRRGKRKFLLGLLLNLLSSTFSYNHYDFEDFLNQMKTLEAEGIIPHSWGNFYSTSWYVLKTSHWPLGHISFPMARLKTDMEKTMFSPTMFSGQSTSLLSFSISFPLV